MDELFASRINLAYTQIYDLVFKKNGKQNHLKKSHVNYQS